MVRSKQLGTIRVDCPNGHRLRASLRLLGRTVPCPACQQEVAVLTRARSISETEAAAMLMEDIPREPLRKTQGTSL